MDGLTSIGDAARAARVSAEWMRQLCDSGRVQHVRDSSGRRLIPQKELERLLQQREQAGRK